MRISGSRDWRKKGGRGIKWTLYHCGMVVQLDCWGGHQYQTGLCACIEKKYAEIDNKDLKFSLKNW